MQRQRSGFPKDRILRTRSVFQGVSGNTSTTSPVITLHDSLGCPIGAQLSLRQTKTYITRHPGLHAQKSIHHYLLCLVLNPFYIITALFFNVPNTATFSVLNSSSKCLLDFITSKARRHIPPARHEHLHHTDHNSPQPTTIHARQVPQTPPPHHLIPATTVPHDTAWTIPNHE